MEQLRLSIEGHSNRCKRIRVISAAAVFNVLQWRSSTIRECPDGQVEYVCKPCPVTCSGEIVECNKKCEPGCACPRDTLLNDAGKCVAAVTSKYICPKLNQIFYSEGECAPPLGCHQTCTSFLKDGKQPVGCTDDCRSNRCGCPVGSLVDVDGNCMTEDQCKAGCAVGEYFYSYRNTCGGCAPCQRSCDDYYKSNVACTFECATEVCRCAPGYVRNPDQDIKGCIPAEECPINKDCGKNAMLLWDGGCAPCETTCNSFFGEAIVCTKLCRLEECVCKEGFVRNAENACIPISECPPPPCGVGEKFYGLNECRPCEEWCLTPNNPCDRRCVFNVCSCAAGLKRVSANNCVAACPAA